MNEKRTLANSMNTASGVFVETGKRVIVERLFESVIPPVNVEEHRSCTSHIHDLEYYSTAHNCIGISARKFIGEKRVSFAVALSRLHRALITITNNQSGGIGIINADSDLSYYIGNESDEDIIEAFGILFENLNLYSRKGCEKPYITFNTGLDTSENGRRVTRLMLEAFLRGDSDGHPFVFPNIVFKLRNEINLNEASPNHDLFMLAAKVTAQRMVPTYFNCDHSSNSDFPPELIGIMGCRSRVAANINGEAGAVGRGNIACSTINLPQLALRAENNIERFRELVHRVMEHTSELLIHRFNTLCRSELIPEIKEMGIYMNSEADDVAEMFRNGTLSIGFIGLWDAVSVIYDVKLSSSDDYSKYFSKAYEIVEMMSSFVKEKRNETGMNISLLASAAEGVTGRFAEYDRTHYGSEASVCSRGFYTNSFHIPVDTDIHFMDKIDLEAPFHKLCDGGCITYVEFSEIPGMNIEAVTEAIRYAHDKDCNYFGINFPLDSCDDCGWNGSTVSECPLCGSHNITRLRRVSGYLSKDTSFTDGKKAELALRRKHFN